MSFVAVPRQNYETFQADGPWQSGAPGWSEAPVPGWGENPNQALPLRRATAGCGCSGLGAEAPAPATDPLTQPLPIWPLLVLTGVGALAMWGTWRLSKMV